MLKSRPVVLDFECFRHKKSGFIIKELAVSTKIYRDTVSFFSHNFIHYTFFECETIIQLGVKMSP